MSTLRDVIIENMVAHCDEQHQDMLEIMLRSYIETIYMLPHNCIVTVIIELDDVNYIKTINRYNIIYPNTGVYIYVNINSKNKTIYNSLLNTVVVNIDDFIGYIDKVMKLNECIRIFVEKQPLPQDIDIII